MNVEDAATAFTAAKTSGWKAFLATAFLAQSGFAADISLAYDGESAARVAIATSAPWPVLAHRACAEGAQQSLSMGETSLPTFRSTQMPSQVPLKRCERRILCGRSSGNNWHTTTPEKKAYTASDSAQASRIDQTAATQTIANQAKTLATSIELGTSRPVRASPSGRRHQDGERHARRRLHLRLPLAAPRSRPSTNTDYLPGASPLATTSGMTLSQTLAFSSPLGQG